MRIVLSVSCMLATAVASLALVACKEQPRARTAVKLAIETFPAPKTRVRAIVAIDADTVMYAGSDGAFGRTSDGGKTWQRQRIGTGDKRPGYRSIARTKDAVHVLSVASPALLYRQVTDTFELVHRDDDPKVFFDSMAFFDDRDGIAFGDPTGPCLAVIRTTDGGKTWTRLPCDKLPRTADGEAAFAASNSNIAIVGDRVWLVTGGKKARVFRSDDRGLSWQVFTTPIVQGKATTGIYSVAFHDAKHGVIVGGDYTDKAATKATKAITTDGGQTWRLVANGKPPGYRSCVQYLPGTGGKEVLAVGATGISHSNDGGSTWREVSDEKGFYTVRFVDKDVAWLGGDQKTGRLRLRRVISR